MPKKNDTNSSCAVETEISKYTDSRLLGDKKEYIDHYTEIIQDDTLYGSLTIQCGLWERMNREKLAGLYDELYTPALEDHTSVLNDKAEKAITYQAFSFRCFIISRYNYTALQKEIEELTQFHIIS